MDEDFKKEVENNYILHWNWRNLVCFPEELKRYGKHLEDIYLKGNKIKRMPKWINQLENLSEIHLADNKLTDIPEEIGCLRSLRILEINNNQIQSLPKSLTSLNDLNCLNVSRNFLTDLPDDIGKLKSLMCLYVGVNNLRWIPSSISGCISLREFNCEYNKITSLPPSMVYMPNIVFISVRHNNLLYLPAIPFCGLPILLVAGNEYLRQVSYDVECLRQNDEWPRLIFIDSEDGCQKKNFEPENGIPQGYSIIRTEAGDVLVIPLNQIHQENSKFVSSLREICLRQVYHLCYSNAEHPRTMNNQQLLDELPECISSELERGPTVLCQKCRKSLFASAFLRIFRNEKQPTLNVIQYFCSNDCVKLFKTTDESSTAMSEVQWLTTLFISQKTEALQSTSTTVYMEIAFTRQSHSIHWL